MLQEREAAIAAAHSATWPDSLPHRSSQQKPTEASIVLVFFFACTARWMLLHVAMASDGTVPMHPALSFKNPTLQP
jgi:hypothetical protein